MSSVRQRKKQAALFARRAYNAAKDANKITKNTEKLINKAIRNGKTINDLKAIFAKEAKKAENYAVTAARTDATRIENKARDDLYNEIFDLGIEIIKRWLATPDDKTRDSHANMSGEEQLTTDKFSNGAKYPGDPDLPPEERCNCRCRIVADVLDLHKMKISDKQKYIEKINELTDRISEEMGLWQNFK